MLVTAGATRESIDPVRFITNHSSGKMGFALAKAAMLRGAEVTLVKAHTDAEPPLFVKTVPVGSAADMYDAVTAVSKEQDIIIKAAAVADYTPVSVADQKVKKSDGEMVIELKRNGCTESALDQIREKKYFDSLSHYQGNLLFVGINYDEKEKTHTCKIVQLPPIA